MSLIKAVILGIVQGLTEFLPVSSSGHLALFHNLLNAQADNILFDVVVHVGTLVPVCIIFRKDILALLKKPFQKTTYLLIVGTIPAVIAALFLRDTVEGLFSDFRFLMCGFFLTGLLLLYADRIRPAHLTKGVKDMSFLDAIVVGLMQAVAIAPSISRSGATTTGALFRKVNREEAAKFVFLLSIPVILGAALLEGVEVATGGVTLLPGDALNLLFGFITSALAGYLSVSLALNLIKKARLRYFSYYLFALAAVICTDVFILKGVIFK